MRALTPAAASATAQRVTQPGHLVELNLGDGQVSRLSSLGDLVWGGHAWAGGRSLAAADVSGAGGRLTIGNIDDAFAALVLNNLVIGQPVRVWAADAGALGPDDPVLLFAGVADAVEVTTQTVVVTLSAQAAGVQWGPRRTIGPASGFNHLVPEGTELKLGNTIITLERRR